MSNAERAAEVVTAIIAKATDPGATDAEARTSALKACHLIREHGLIVSAPGRARAPESPIGAQSGDTIRRWPDAGPAPRARPKERWRPATAKGKAPETRRVRANRSGFCTLCGDTYSEGDEVIFDVATRELMHPTCREQRGRKPDLS